MQIILREDVENLGKAGEVVNVRDGYGRNYLIPKGFAVLATPRNMRRMEHERRVIDQHRARVAKDAEAVKARIESLSLTVAKQTGEEGKLFGSVTTREVADALKEEGIEMDRKRIRIDEPIRSLGVFTIEVKLTADMTANLKLWVVAK